MNLLPPRDFAAAFEAGERRIVCPNCNGGTSGERSMALYLDFTGQLNYHCFRAGCHWGGVVGGRALPGPVAPVKPDSRAFREPVYAYNPDTYERMEARFGIVGPCSYTADGHPLLHILSPRGALRGYMLRRTFWGEAGDNGPKTITYMNDMDETQLSWHAPPEDTSGCIVLVEDIVSAWKCAEAGYYSVALLGTGLNQQKVAEIAREGGRDISVLIALDKDATGVAFAHARKYGLAFCSCRVVLLEKDLKDTDVEDIPEVLG